ncbi:transposase domain-containing protein [Streptomyces sp. NPDC058231]|uniref:transposase domain-containing protein n=1 Tax=Streptomyces sp. NPDC058231 TaxID=3346392 RepID=UPI0036E5B053
MDDGDPPRSSLPTDGIPLRLQSAITTITRSLTVAFGLFAPGRIGELTPYVPFELVDSVLEETGRVQRRLRALHVFALVLFPELSYAAVWRQLTASLDPTKPPRVSETALRHLRRRLSPAPFKVLFQTLAVPLAPPATPGVSYRRWRTVAFDGCSSIKTPDSDRARTWLGKVRYRLAWAG